ncbi:MAG: alpha/beta hydrolase [Fimbriimonadaceae bacterium]|nr:alpha/beta hydrolase [Fimbriimonadaceae bacterium]QYK55439.1 MAG: alpha/beta hydrolase [Fimbriimonadaceae bacterium]
MLSLALLVAANLGLDVRTEVPYRTVGGKTLMMDIYKPKGEAEEEIPMVVVIHGGTWMAGKRQDMAAICQAIAREGMAAATVDYRLAPNSRWPAMIEDCQAAVRFLRAKADDYGLDTDAFGSCGASAGGHLALLLGLTDTWEQDPADNPDQSSRVGAVFNLFGPVDLTQDFDVKLADFVSKAVIGKPYADSKEEIARFSPITYVDGTQPPIFTLQGEADTVVPFRQAQRLDEAVRAKGGTHELTLLKKMGHGIDEKDPEQMKGVKAGIDFLKDLLLRKVAGTLRG